MIKIVYEKKEKTKMKYSELGMGYYLIQRKYDGKKGILSVNISGDNHFIHENNLYSTHADKEYIGFEDIYIIISKIKHFKISDIELE